MLIYGILLVWILAGWFAMLAGMPDCKDLNAYNKTMVIVTFLVFGPALLAAMLAVSILSIYLPEDWWNT